MSRKPSKRKSVIGGMAASSSANPMTVNPIPSAAPNHINNPGIRGPVNINPAYSSNWGSDIYTRPQYSPAWPVFDSQTLVPQGIQSQAALPYTWPPHIYDNNSQYNSNSVQAVGRENQDALGRILEFNAPSHDQYVEPARLMRSRIPTQEGLERFNARDQLARPQYMTGSVNRKRPSLTLENLNDYRVPHKFLSQYQPYYSVDTCNQSMQPEARGAGPSNAERGHNWREGFPVQNLVVVDIEEFKKAELARIVKPLDFDDLWNTHVKEAYEETIASMKQLAPGAGTASNSRRYKGNRRAEDVEEKKHILSYELTYDYLELRLVALVWKTKKAMSTETINRDFNIFALLYEIARKIFNAMADMSNVRHGSLSSWDSIRNEHMSLKEGIERNFAVYEELFEIKSEGRKYTQATSSKEQTKPSSIQQFVKIYMHRPDLLVLGALHCAIEFCLVRSWDDILTINDFHVTRFSRQFLSRAAASTEQGQDPQLPEAQKAFDILIKLYQTSKSYVQELCQIDRIAQAVAAPNKKIHANNTNMSYARKKAEAQRILEKAGADSPPVPPPASSNIPEVMSINDASARPRSASLDQFRLAQDPDTQPQPQLVPSSAPVRDRPSVRCTTIQKAAHEANVRTAAEPTSRIPLSRCDSGPPPPEPQPLHANYFMPAALLLNSDFDVPINVTDSLGTLEYGNVQDLQIPQAAYQDYIDGLSHALAQPAVEVSIPRRTEPGPRSIYSPYTGHIDLASSDSDLRSHRTDVPAAINTQLQEVTPENVTQVAQARNSVRISPHFDLEDYVNFNLGMGNQERRKPINERGYQNLNSEQMVQLQSDQEHDIELLEERLSKSPRESTEPPQPELEERLSKSPRESTEPPQPELDTSLQFHIADQDQGGLQTEPESGLEQPGMNHGSTASNIDQYIGSGALDDLGGDGEFDLDKELFGDEEFDLDKELFQDEDIHGWAHQPENDILQ